MTLARYRSNTLGLLAGCGVLGAGAASAAQSQRPADPVQRHDVRRPRSEGTRSGEPHKG